MKQGMLKSQPMTPCGWPRASDPAHFLRVAGGKSHAKLLSLGGNRPAQFFQSDEAVRRFLMQGVVSKSSKVHEGGWARVGGGIVFALFDILD
jgi:hypothetical protein